MKKMNSILMLLSLCLLSHLSYGQIDLRKQEEVNSSAYPDTLILETDSKQKITLAFYRMSDQKQYLSNDLWKSILSTMESAVLSSQYNEGLEVSYRKATEGQEEVVEVEVKPILAGSDVFVIDKQGINEIPADRLEFKIYESKVSVSFFLTDLNQLEEMKKMNIESIWEQVALKYKNYGKRNLYTGQGMIKFGNANIEKITARSLGKDAIELSAGVGLGFYRDRFVPDLGFKVAFHMPNRLGEEKLEFGLLYTQHYFYSREPAGDYNLDLNGFLSGFVSHRFLENQELGLSFGALIHRDGGFFEGPTYRMSLYTAGDESGLNFSPELIFTDGFRKGFPALRIGLTF